jgi:hypothetical protein
MPQIDLGAVVVYLIVAVVVCIYFYTAWIAARGWAFTYWLALYGTQTEGEIIQTRAIGSAKGGSQQFVTYRFNVQKSGEVMTYSKEQAITRRHASELSEGNHVIIKYIPTNPNLSALSGDDTDNIEHDTTTLVSLLVWPVPITLTLMVLLLLNRYYLKPKGQS